MSSDWGTTWGTVRTLIQWEGQCYLATSLMADGKTLRCAMSGHPNDPQSSNHNIMAFKIDLETGGVYPVGSFTSVANVRTGVGLPLTSSSMSYAYNCPVGETLNLFDISNCPDYYEIFFAQKRKNHTNMRYMYLSNKTGVWVAEELCPTGKIFGFTDAGMYVGSGCFPWDADGGRCILSRENAGTWTLEHWRKQTDGKWLFNVLDKSDLPLIRPHGVKSDTTFNENVCYYRVYRYGSNYDDYYSDLALISVV